MLFRQTFGQSICNLKKITKKFHLLRHLIYIFIETSCEHRHTAKPNGSRQNQTAHDETKRLTTKPKGTSKPKSSRQNQKAHDETKRHIKTKKFTVKPKGTRQNHKAHGETKRHTVKSKAHGKIKRLPAKPKGSRQYN